MGLFNFIKSQLIEVIEWTDDSKDTMVYRFPVENKEIKMGAQLTVRESQVAVFVDEGMIADVFTPGRYTLDTANMPVITKLKSWKHGFNSPFKSEIYFVNTKQFTNCKWGTTNPIMKRDADFGMVRIRMFGVYSFKVSDAQAFLKEVFGTSSYFTVDGITGQLKSSIVSGVADLMAETAIPALDLAMRYVEIGDLSKDRLQEKFNNLGLTLVSISVENISLPPEVEAMMDKRTSMGILGDSLNQYTKYQAAEAMREAAQNPGGIAGAGIGLGAGVGIGNVYAEALRQNVAPVTPQAPQAPQAPAQAAPAAATTKCSSCGAGMAAGAKFCIECGTKVTSVSLKCSNCGGDFPENSKFCPECGQKR